jgi:hypothetical protein
MPPFEPNALGSLREGKNRAKRAEPIMGISPLSQKQLFLFYSLRFIRMKIASGNTAIHGLSENWRAIAIPSRAV